MEKVVGRGVAGFSGVEARCAMGRGREGEIGKERLDLAKKHSIFTP